MSEETKTAQEKPTKAQIESNLQKLKAQVYDLNAVRNTLDQQIAMYNNQISQQGILLEELIAKEPKESVKVDGESPSPYVEPKAE